MLKRISRTNRLLQRVVGWQLDLHKSASAYCLQWAFVRPLAEERV